MELTILNWNIQGTKYYTKTNIKKILPSLESIKADVFCIQEAQEFKNKIKDVNIFKGSDYVFSEQNRNGAQLTVSKHKIINSRKLELPVFKEKSIQALRTDIDLGEKKLRIYNCHLEIFKAGSSDRLKQLEYILEDAKKHDGPVIICGDFNSVIPKKGFGRFAIKTFHKEYGGNFPLKKEINEKAEKFLVLETANKYGYKEVLDINQTTWGVYPFAIELFKLKLDWFLVKGIDILAYSLGDYISDHRSITVKCRIN